MGHLMALYVHLRALFEEGGSESEFNCGLVEWNMTGAMGFNLSGGYFPPASVCMCESILHFAQQKDTIAMKEDLQCHSCQQ